MHFARFGTKGSSNQCKFQMTLHRPPTKPFREITWTPEAAWGEKLKNGRAAPQQEPQGRWSVLIKDEIVFLGGGIVLTGGEGVLVMQYNLGDIMQYWLLSERGGIGHSL